MKIQVQATIHPAEGEPRELSFDLNAKDLQGEALEALVRDLSDVVHHALNQSMGVLSKHNAHP